MGHGTERKPWKLENQHLNELQNQAIMKSCKLGFLTNTHPSSLTAGNGPQNDGLEKVTPGLNMAMVGI